MTTNNWTKTGSGDWAASSNWSGCEPSTADNAVIAEGKPEIRSNAGTVASVRLSAELHIGGSGALAVADLFSNTTGTLNVDDTGYGEGSERTTARWRPVL